MTRLRSEAGFTLMEVLVAMVAGMVVIVTAFTLMDVTLRRTGDVVSRVDASQRGRLAMEQVTQTLRSQVCRGLGAAEPAIVAGTASSITVHRDFSDGAQFATRPPERVQLAHEGRTLTERVYEWSAALPAPGYPSTPTRTRVLLEDVAADGSAPLFAYRKFNTSTPPQPVVPVTTIDADSAKTVAVITVRFSALPRNADASSRQRLVLEDQVFVRHADPNDTAPRPQCA